jgi:hypothetical protein
LADCGAYVQAKPTSARQAFVYLNAACTDHPKPARRLKGSHFPHFSLVFSHLAVVALLGIPADEAIDGSEVISKGLTLKSIYDREMCDLLVLSPILGDDRRIILPALENSGKISGV